MNKYVNKWDIINNVIEKISLQCKNNTIIITRRYKI